MSANSRFGLSSPIARRFKGAVAAAVMAGVTIAVPVVSAGSAEAATANSPAALQKLAAQIVPANQLASFDQIISNESGWRVNATNPSSGSYGLPQALPASKMASAGSDWRTNPSTQLRWALKYMNGRYGSPNQAWVFWQNHHWY
ncbi:transglycosylase SLT domain-containing protein [Kitasatospora aureofaciens]|uniref:aggregation-promoting factor C-terminal-like domain-containing protein n=1 Tax=Kitasatospora aureofaciens TaxID=1894 RepID=UPI0033DBDDA8